MNNNVILDNIENSIKIILNELFPNSNKSIIKKYYNRLNFACPFCGDSSINENKKRGNLYFDTLEYHCFNCGIHLNIYQLLKRLSIKIKLSDLNKFYNIDRKKTFIESSIEIEPDLLFSIDELKNEYKFYEIEKNDIIYKYLKSRAIPTDKMMYFLKTLRNELIILNLDISSSKVISFFIRNIFSKKYKTISYDIINKDIKKTTDENIILLYRKISTLFNIFNINFYEKIYILEGQFDSLFINNSISISGLSNLNKIKKIDNLFDLYYILDNDDIGRKYAIKLISENKKVFLWNKYLKDNKINNTYIKDINDLILYSKKHNIKLTNINEYFSNNKTDIIYL